MHNNKLLDAGSTHLTSILIYFYIQYVLYFIIYIHTYNIYISIFYISLFIINMNMMIVTIIVMCRYICGPHTFILIENIPIDMVYHWGHDNMPMITHWVHVKIVANFVDACFIFLNNTMIIIAQIVTPSEYIQWSYSDRIYI